MTLLAASPEEKYFETRDNFIREFEKAASTPTDSLAEQDEHALAELEKQLKPIVGAVNVEGFPKEGKINLETLAFTAGEAVTYFAEIPVKSPNEKSYVRAFLGLTAQDIGPFIPKDIFVFVTKGNRILAVQSPAATEITEIPQCRSEWERFARKKSDADEVYRSSGLTNEKEFDEEVQQYEQQGFEAYQRC